MVDRHEEPWLAASLRNLALGIAWTAGPWAAGEWLGLWAVPVALALLWAVPWLLTRLAPPSEGSIAAGVVQVSLAVDFAVVAVVAMWYLFGPAGGLITLAIALLGQVLGWRRTLGLAQGSGDDDA